VTATIRQHKIIAIIGFIVLISVQCFLIYNTYKLKNDEFYSTEKDIIKELYRSSIRNDKIFPGGQAIMDRYLITNMERFETLYNTDLPQYHAFAKSVKDSMIAELKMNNNIDVLMQGFIGAKGLDSTLKWASTLDFIGLTFDGKNYVPLFNRTTMRQGVLVNGGLSELNKQNEVTTITVSSAQAYSYAATFGLYADTPYRVFHILKSMTVPLAISFFSILTVTLIYYFTFRNWLKQKKLAELKSDFVNSITHELHTPLSAIIVANKSLQNPRIIADKEKILPLTAVIDRQSQRLKTLFAQVLDLTVMNASSLLKEDIILESLLEEALLDYRLQLANSNVSISYKNDSNYSVVSLDKFWTTTMINNLLDNAIKYNNNRLKQIEVQTRQEGDHVLLILSDNGVGIPDRIRHLIFDKFYRNTDRLENKASNGLGLGLFYTKQCVDAHNWQMDIRTNELNGSDFIIKIPLEQ
jgi:two-component system phosphate regulon sensor histidine kinase PhoR